MSWLDFKQFFLIITDFAGAGHFIGKFGHEDVPPSKIPFSTFEYYPEIGRSIAIRLRSTIESQLFDRVRLHSIGSLRFWFDRVRLTSSGHKQLHLGSLICLCHA